MKDIILLGAGASVDADIPAAYKMTEELIKLFGENSKYSHIIRFAVGGLLMQKGVRGENPFEGVNIEDVFNAIELLANRENLEAAPFIGSWHRLVEELDLIRPFGPYDQSHSARLQSRSIRSTKRRPHYLSTEPLPSEGKNYEDANAAMISSLKKMVWLENPQKTEHLWPMLQIKTQDILTIATLNYDNTIELAAKHLTKEIQIGIEEWSSSGFFPKAKSGFYFLKLHGSIDWMYQPSTQPLFHQTIRRLPFDLMNKSFNYRPAVIFGHRNKLTAKGPFLDMLRAFEEQLNEADRLTIIGYSFRDEHINEQIRKWMAGSSSRTIRIINGKHFASNDIQFARSLLSIKDRVDNLNVGAKEGIAKCFA